LIRGEVILQAEELIVEVITAESESARFALAHQIPGKIDAVAKDIKLAQMRNGDTFGEDSLISDSLRNVTITALTDTSLLRLGKKQFLSLIKKPSLKFVNYAQMQEALKHGTTGCSFSG
jgi:CRP-like cAMP-binding protein